MWAAHQGGDVALIPALEAVSAITDGPFAELRGPAGRESALAGSASAPIQSYTMHLTDN